MFRNPRRTCEDLYKFVCWFVKFIVFFVKHANDFYSVYTFDNEPAIIKNGWCDLDENNIIHEKRTRTLTHGYCFYDEEETSEEEEEEEEDVSSEEEEEEEDTISLKLPEDLGQDLGQDPVQDLGQDPVQETINKIVEEPSTEPSTESLIDSDEDIYKSAKTI